MDGIDSKKSNPTLIDSTSSESSEKSIGYRVLSRIRQPLAFLLAALMFCTSAKGQLEIKMGEGADRVKWLIEGMVSQYQSAKGYQQARYSHQTLWNNGQIVEVILQEENVPHPILRRPIADRVRFIMSNGFLSKRVREYFDVSLEELKRVTKQANTDNFFDGLYFNRDYTVVTQITLSENHLAASITKFVKLSEFPAPMQAAIKKLQLNAATRIKQEERQKNKEAEEDAEARKIVVHLNSYEGDYNYFKENLQAKIQAYIKAKAPSWQDLSRDRNYQACYSVHNLYNCHFKLEDHSRPAKNYGSVTVAGSRDIRVVSDCRLLRGTDARCELFEQITIPLQTIPDSKDRELMSEAFIDSVETNYVKGITMVRTGNKGVKFIKFPPLDANSIERITHFVSGMNGTFLVRYEVGSVMGKEISNLSVEKPNRNQYDIF